MHEIMTGEKYNLPKIDDKNAAKKEKATLQEVREEEEEETEGNETSEEIRVTGDTVNQTQGKPFEGFNEKLSGIKSLITDAGFWCKI